MLLTLLASLSPTIFCVLLSLSAPSPLPLSLCSFSYVPVSPSPLPLLSLSLCAPCLCVLLSLSAPSPAQWPRFAVPLVAGDVSWGVIGVDGFHVYQVGIHTLPLSPRIHALSLHSPPLTPLSPVSLSPLAQGGLTEGAFVDDKEVLAWLQELGKLFGNAAYDTREARALRKVRPSPLYTTPLPPSPPFVALSPSPTPSPLPHSQCLMSHPPPPSFPPCCAPFPLCENEQQIEAYAMNWQASSLGLSQEILSRAMAVTIGCKLMEVGLGLSSH